ncbi:hypothetical protein KCP77_23955 [Salmonella enterica subsp. enterica]|nr:hypothetical protein KCP77_23955 [Salmonella enterica subsp. enterica]
MAILSELQQYAVLDPGGRRVKAVCRIRPGGRIRHFLLDHALQTARRAAGLPLTLTRSPPVFVCRRSSQTHLDGGSNLYINHRAFAGSPPESVRVDLMA